MCTNQLRKRLFSTGTGVKSDSTDVKYCRLYQRESSSTIDYRS
nr:MAG TPA: hypothetical protein [Crassvirales sp.]